MVNLRWKSQLHYRHIAIIQAALILLSESILAQQIVRAPIPEAEITSLGEALWRADVNNVASDITINVQEKASRDGKDQAPRPLLTVPQSVYQKPTFSKFITLFDNYVAATNVGEVVTPQETAEETAFLDAIMDTSVIQKVEEFLANKRLFINHRTDNTGRQHMIPNAFRNILRAALFDLYARQGNVIASSGFEHIFLGETRNGEVLGLHNWIFFAKQEESGALNYLGHIRVLRLGNKGMALKEKFTWNALPKPVSSMLIGTSPEFEIALYMLCYYTRPGTKCPITLDGKSVPISTYFINRNGKRYLSSAFPEI